MEKLLIDELSLLDIIKNLSSADCLGCGGKKARAKSHCRDDYYQLPPEMRSALYRKIGQGYEQAFKSSLHYLADLKGSDAGDYSDE